MVLHFFSQCEAFLLVVTTNAGAVCWFQTFVPESGVAQSDILIKVVVLEYLYKENIQ